jgi:tryptophanyl-tRNA synthetase
MDCKKALHGAMVAELTPIRERAAALQAEPARVLEALGDGAARARAVARETVREVRAIMGLDPLSAAAASLPATGDVAPG